MNTPRLTERHFVICTLCGEDSEVQVFTSLKLKTEWLTNHARGQHWKRSAYVPDAMQTVTVLYEKEVPGSDQEANMVDPTDAFLYMLTVLRNEEPK